MKKRWKKITKMLAAAIVAVTCMCAGSGITVLANVNQAEVDAVNAEAEAQTEALAQTPAETEAPAETKPEAPVIDRSGTEGDTFSVPGNGEVVDHITDDSSKEFYTIRTANNNTFYMVIDHSATSENVYMLSSIDEADLSEFIKETEKETQKETQPPVILEENIQKEPVTEEVEKESGMPKNLGGMLVIAVIAVFGVAAYYFLKIKPKKEEEEPESENLELEDGLETINEDEEESYYLDEEDK